MQNIMSENAKLKKKYYNIFAPIGIRQLYE